jgi:lipoprotein LprG
MKRLVALGAVLVFAVTGCTGSKGSGGTPTSADDAVVMLTDAKKTIDETASVHLVITGRGLPDTAQTLASGDGVATHSPAFKGKLTVRAAGSSIDAEVVAVGGKVYAKLPFTSNFIVLPPSQLAGLGAPDPAVKGETRDGSKVLTEVTGSIQGKTLQGIFPKAPADRDFPSSFKIDRSTKQLVSATITGTFYDGATSSYEVTLDKYGEKVEITKP